MPRRMRRMRRLPVVLDGLFLLENDFDFDDYGYEEEEEVQEGDDDNASEEHDGTEGPDSESEGNGDDDDDEHSGGEHCAPSVGARVSGAEAADKGSLSSCPVCMEALTSEGAHRISCIPCGHVYGRSCLERWLDTAKRGNQNQSATCPQCGKRYTHKNIINLYAPEIAVPNNELQKAISNLTDKITSLEKMSKRHESLLLDLSKRSIDMEQRIIDAVSSKRLKIMEPWDETGRLELSKSVTVDLILQRELPLDGARVMNLDASEQIILASGRAPSLGGSEHVITKINMHCIAQPRKVYLPPDTKAVRDICILRYDSAVFTSLGKKLSLFSTTAECVVLQCDLPAPGWSCSADLPGSHHIYAGLQNGTLLTFDIRKSARPLCSTPGLSAHPIHTLHSVIDSSGSRKIFSASAVGPCMWDGEGSERRPNLLLRMENQPVCISLACAPSSDLLVASFRPQVESSSEDAAASQVYLSQTPTRTSSGKLGHHTLIRKNRDNTFFAEGAPCYASVSEMRMSKSTIIPYGNNQHLFAYGDESLHGVRTWQLPSFGLHVDLSPHRQPILDLRYAESPRGGRYLGCLSKEKLQIFTVKDREQ